MPSKRSSSSAVAEASLSASDVPWIHPELASSAIAAGGAGGLGLIAVSALANDPSNVRRHGEKNHEATRASLRKFGQRTPIVVQKQGMVVRAGNDRLAIFREEGWSHIVALVVNENDVEATAYAIADNRTGELAEWDDDALARQLDALQKQGIDLDGLGFDLDDLDDLDLGELEPDADLDDAHTVARRVQSRLSQLALPHRGGGELQRVTMSLGVASLVPSLRFCSFGSFFSGFFSDFSDKARDYVFTGLQFAAQTVIFAIVDIISPFAAVHQKDALLVPGHNIAEGSQDRTIGHDSSFKKNLL